MKQLYAHSTKVRSYRTRTPSGGVMDVFADARVSLVTRDEADRVDQKRLADGFAEFVVVEFGCHTAGRFVTTGLTLQSVAVLPSWADRSVVEATTQCLGRVVIDVLAKGDLFAALAVANEGVLDWERTCGGAFHDRLMASELRNEIIGDA